MTEEEEFEFRHRLERERGGGGSSKLAEKSTLRGQIVSSVLDMIRPGGIGKTLSHGLETAGTSAGEFVNDQAARILPAAGAATLGAAANAAVQLGPMAVGGGAVGKTAAPVMEDAGRRLMKSAVKPTWEAQRSGKADRAITTLLEEGYNPTRGGVDAMKTRIADLKGQEQAITGASTQTANKYSIGNKLDDVLKQIEEGTLTKDATASVMKVWDEFLSHPSFTGKTDVPISVLQKMKERNYKTLGDAAYGIGLKPAAERDALKALNSSIKGAIETAEPGVVPLNAKMSELLNAKKVAERRALMEGNKNPVALPTSVAAVAHDPMAALGLWANSSALAKSALARMLYTGSEAIPMTAGAASGGTLQAIIQQAIIANQREGR